jgi:hypothetical protein
MANLKKYEKGSNKSKLPSWIYKRSLNIWIILFRNILHYCPLSDNLVIKTGFEVGYISSELCKVAEYYAYDNKPSDSLGSKKCIHKMSNYQLLKAEPDLRALEVRV